ncbi:ABC transporter substrate-binding protein [Leadbettera azotonutricia]|uniref:Putative bacterial extracellular solute-binding protein n=1 Tax=Leadbettera azotonutricia (strain ATCC BAA-888 / DSM 13862 / ZAS-9) TaxID=545695 RepID=F5YG91_LEAAZ|nr:extracellular solute-binding protein [Leadbettera azotonutricia]AEF80592.1 putative bacterial extracellular solute-binding protein [Leadbettera azotonutricia ZAS-9]
MRKCFGKSKNVKSVCLLLLTVFFIGCSKNTTKSGEVPTSAGPQKLLLYTWTNTDVIQPLLDGFNRDYAGKWEVEHIRLANALTMTINTALASGEQVDVMTQGSPIDLRQRYDDGIYLGMKQFLVKDGLTYEGVFGESTEKVYNFDGDYYAIPYGLQRAVVFFNKKMFDEIGVPYPDPNWTWADFRELAKKLTKGNGANKVYGAMYNLNPYWDHIASQRLGPFYYYSPDHQSTRFDAPEIREDLQFFYDMFMVDKTVMPYDEYMTLQLQDAANGMKALYSGRYAMWIADDGNNLFLDDSYTGGKLPSGTDIGMVGFPRPVGYNGLVTITHGSTTSIPASTKYPDGAWALAKYQCIDHADLFAGPKAMHPGYELKTDAEKLIFYSMLFKGRPGLDYNMAMEVTTRPYTLINRDNTIVQGQQKINDLILANVSRLFNGELTVDAVLSDLKTKGDQYIADDMKK